MAKILIAYATGEGQTRRVAQTLGEELRQLGHEAREVDLGSRATAVDVGAQDAVVLAASVHGGKHQAEAARFVEDHRQELQRASTAFLSVSLSAAATEVAGQQRAVEQAQAFLEQTEWQPDLVHAVAGAFRYSAFSRPWRWLLRLSNRLARKDLVRMGWPQLTEDREFTDWQDLRRFGGELAAML